VAKGEYSPANSDVNVMLVLAEVTVETLDRAAGPLQQGIHEMNLAVMVLSEEDLHRSTDVFPTKFLDIQRHHRVLWGKDVLAGLHISHDHLRLRCEQEIKNLLLRLRQSYVQRARHPDLIESALTHAISVFLNALGVLLMLKTGKAPSGKAEVAEAAASQLGLDAGVLRALLELKAGSYHPESEELKGLYDALMENVRKAAEIVDRHGEAPNEGA
jgi:hypothetical protein